MNDGHLMFLTAQLMQAKVRELTDSLLRSAKDFFPATAMQISLQSEGSIDLPRQVVQDRLPPIGQLSTPLRPHTVREARLFLEHEPKPASCCQPNRSACWAMYGVTSRPCMNRGMPCDTTVSLR